MRLVDALIGLALMVWLCFLVWEDFGGIDVILTLLAISTMGAHLKAVNEKREEGVVPRGSLYTGIFILWFLSVLAYWSGVLRMDY